MNRVLVQEDKILQIAVATRYPFIISKITWICAHKFCLIKREDY